MPKESIIKHYSSSTTGSVPSAVDLVEGELAINTADEKVFFKNLGGTVVDISQSKGISGTYARLASSVSSLNGLTGARTLTGDGGAIIGAANNTIRARLATASLTGVASFPATDFAVSAAGAVTLTGNVAKTNVAQTFTAFQNFTSGLSGNLTGNATTATTATNSNSLGGTAANSWALASSIGNGTLTLNVSGTGLTSGIQTFTANQSGNTTFTVTSNATSANTAGAIVSRDSNGDFTGRYIFAQYFNHSHSAAYRGADTQFYSSTDDYIRKNTKAGFLASLGLTNTASVNTVGTIVLRDGSGNFSAGTITATLSGTATQVSNALTIGSGLAGTSSTYNGSAAVTIANTGVLSLNGLTGARTLTGDGGAIVGVGNDTIRARLATTTATGAASFSSTNFDVSAGGAVSVKTGGISNTNLVSSTISGVSLGSNLNALTIGTGLGGSSYNGQTAATITNTGVLSFNSQTGAVTYSPAIASTSATGVASFNSTYFSVSSGAVSLASAYQATGDTVITVPGSGIAISTSGKTDTLFNIGVTSINGATGAVSNVAFTNVAQTFTALQTFSVGISGEGATFSGHLSAATKSFVIPHPTVSGMKLHHGSLEGPENGVYVRGHAHGRTVDLPHYWTGLVDESTITVQVTPFGRSQNLYVESVSIHRVVIGGDENPSYFYTVYGERKDVPKLKVEV